MSRLIHLPRESQGDNEFNKLISCINNVIEGTYQNVVPVLKAGGGFDTEALRQLVFTNALDGVHTLSKDELQILVATAVADDVMEKISTRPWGGDKPDKLS